MTGLVIALDTSTDVRVGVARAGEVLAARAVEDPRAHVERLVPLVRDVVAEAGASLDALSLVCVGLGPGPFTGLRVGIIAGRVLASVRRVPLHGVCSLDVVARAYAAGAVTDPFVVVSDARRREVYWAQYAADGVRIGAPRVSAPQDLPDLPIVGPGVTVHREALGSRAVEGPATVDAGLLAALGEAIPGAGTEPLYLRRPDAVVPTRRKSTLVTPPVRVRRGGR